jgi:hypothetical protein
MIITLMIKKNAKFSPEIGDNRWKSWALDWPLGCFQYFFQNFGHKTEVPKIQASILPYPRTSSRKRPSGSPCRSRAAQSPTNVENDQSKVRKAHKIAQSVQKLFSKVT